jgi:hypothetical protein
MTSWPRPTQNAVLLIETAASLAEGPWQNRKKTAQETNLREKARLLMVPINWQ